MAQRFPLSYGSTLIAATTLAIMGCSSVFGNPVTMVSDQDRKVISEQNGEPKEVRLTKPATVVGLQLAAGSVVKEDGGIYRIQTGEQLTARGATFPPGTWLEIKMHVDEWMWDGVVDLGGSFTYGVIPGEKGDRLYFSGPEWSMATLNEVRIKTPRTIEGKSLPADSVIDLDRDGKVHATYTPEEQRSCRETCAIITDRYANSQCRANCGGL